MNLGARQLNRLNCIEDGQSRMVNPNKSTGPPQRFSFSLPRRKRRLAGGSGPRSKATAERFTAWS